MQTAANDIDAPGHEVCVYIRPAKPSSNLDCLRVHIYHYVSELCHRDVDTQSGREAWVGSVASSFDCKRYTGPRELMELRRPAGSRADNSEVEVYTNEDEDSSRLGQRHGAYKVLLSTPTPESLNLPSEKCPPRTLECLQGISRSQCVHYGVGCIISPRRN